MKIYTDDIFQFERYNNIGEITEIADFYDNNNTVAKNLIVKSDSVIILYKGLNIDLINCEAFSVTAENIENNRNFDKALFHKEGVFVFDETVQTIYNYLINSDKFIESDMILDKKLNDDVIVNFIIYVLYPGYIVKVLKQKNFIEIDIA